MLSQQLQDGLNQYNRSASYIGTKISSVKLLPKPIRQETFTYYAERPLDETRLQMQQLFDKTKNWDFSVNLTGEFLSDYKFRITPKWQLIRFSGACKEVARLDGALTADGIQKTKVNLSVKANLIFTLFFIISPLFGCAALFGTAVKGKETDKIIVGLVFTFVVPAFMLVSAHLAKKGIKNRFIHFFGLKQAINNEDHTNTQ